MASVLEYGSVTPPGIVVVVTCTTDFQSAYSSKSVGQQKSK
jgi:hypothetical protein